MPQKKEGELTPLERFREVFIDVKAPKGGLPTMPTKISDIASDELGDMIARYSAWREYTEDRHAEACAVYSQYKSEYDLATAREMLTTTGNTVTEKKAVVQAKVSLAYSNMVESGIYKDLLANKLDSFSNVLAMLSRELTRRGVMVG